MQERPTIEDLQLALMAHTGNEYKWVAGHGGKKLRGPCPFCGGKDRFDLWISDGWIAWACNNCPYPQTEKVLFERLGWDYTNIPALAYKPKRQIPCPSVLDYKDVVISTERINEAHSEGYEKAADYFNQFGINDPIINQFEIGYLNYVNRKNVRIAGYTIPYYYTLPNGQQVVQGVRVRRDDLTADPAMPKYYGLWSSHLGGVWNTKVVNSPDGKYRAPLLDCLFITEDEKSCMVMTRILRGYSHLACIAYHPQENWNAHLNTVVSNASKVIVLQDNDDDKNNGNAGLTNALRLQGWITKVPIVIIKPEVNDMADLVVRSGLIYAETWLRDQPACKYLF